MAAITDIVDAKLKNLREIPDALTTSVDRQQKKLLTEISSALDSLDIEDALIKISQSNIAKIESIITSMQDVFFDKDYVEAVKSFASGIDAQAVLTRDLISAGFGKLRPKKLYEQILRSTRKNAVSLFGEAVMDQVYFEPLRQQMLTSITTGASFKDTLKAVQLITVGDADADGLLHTHAKTYSRTAYAQADATYTTTISRDLGVEFYKYAGSEIETTREFCQVRHNKYYHVDEVEEWGTLGNWSGKIKGTNSSTIFSNRGGWNCRHSLVPVSEAIVPKEVLRRAISKGYYKPTEEEKEILGI